MLFSSKLDSTVINAWIIENDHLAWDRRATLTFRSSKPQRRTAPARSDVAKRTMRVEVATVVRATKQFSRASKRIPVVMQSKERLLCRSIMHYTSYLRTKDCTNNGYVTDMLEHNTMINIDTGVHMISHNTQT